MGRSRARSCPWRWPGSVAWRSLGEAHARRGDFTRARRAGEGPDAGEADGHYRRALALAEALGLRPLAAHCHLGLGTLHRRSGTRQQAEEHLRTAASMFREMGMRYWLERVEAGPGEER